MNEVLMNNVSDDELRDDTYYLEKAIDPSKFEKICRKFEDTLFDISSYILLFVTAFVCADVFMRYVFNRPFRITIPISELLEVFIVAFGGAYLLREEGFVTIDLLISKVKRTTRFLLVAITSFTSAVFLLVMFYGSLQKSIEFITTNAVFLDSPEFPAWLYMVPMTFFYFILAVGFLRRGIRYLRARKLVILDEA